MTMSQDRVLRALTADGTFRVVVADTTFTTREAVRLQHGTGEGARIFANLLTCAVLFRETMAPELRVQVIAQGARGEGNLVADSAPSGLTRGLIQPTAPGRQVSLGPGASLRVMRTMPNGQLFQGLVTIESNDIADAFMLYLDHSEQTKSAVALGALVEGDRVVRAGGFLVQLLPDLDRGYLMVMLERLQEFANLGEQLSSPQFSAEQLLGELLHDMPHTTTANRDVSFGCWCGEERVLGALATLGRKELEELAEAGEPLDIGCDYCAKRYVIAPQRLLEPLEPR